MQKREVAGHWENISKETGGKDGKCATVEKEKPRRTRLIKRKSEDAA